MKVDIIIAVAERGGPENIIRMMIRKLTSPDMQFRVVQMAWEGYRWLDDDVAFYPLTEGKGGHTIVEFCQAYSALLEETKEIPDLVLAAAWPYMNVLAKQVFAEKGLHIPVVSWLHTDVEAYARKGFGGWPELLTADAHFAISDGIRKAIAGHEKKAPVYRLHNPVEIAQAAEDMPPARGGGLRHTLLFVGRLSQEKNISLSLQTLALLPSWNLILAGDGEERERLQDLCQKLGLSQRVRFLGWQEEPWKYAPEADALILCSLYEGFPLTVIEALSHGLPVLSTKVNGIPELIHPGINGYLYDTGDREGLMHLLMQIDAQGFVVEYPEQCQAYAGEYDSDFALWDMAVKMKAVCRGIRLRPNTSNHPWFAFRQKLSIIFRMQEWNSKRLEETLDTLCRGKNRILDLQPVLVAEQNDPDALRLSQQFADAWPERIQSLSIPAGPYTQAEFEVLLSRLAVGRYCLFPEADQSINTKDIMKTLEQHFLQK